MKTLFYSLYIIILLLTSISCKKEKEKVYPTYYMEQEFKDYVVFPVGSYWVYEEETSGEIDSVYLFKKESSINNLRKSVPYNYELSEMTFLSSYYNDALLASADAELMGQTPSFCTFSESYLNDHNNYSYYYFSSNTPGEILYFDNNLMYKEYLVKCVFKNITYNSVKHFQCINQRFNLQVRDIYYSRYIGVIRKELFNGQVWNLKRYHIAH